MAQTVLTPPRLDTDSGLSAAEVQERIRRGETNDYKARVSRSYPAIIIDNIFNLFNIILFSLLVIVISFGDYTTALFAGFSVVTNSLLGTVQEINARRRLDRLAALQEQQVRVQRDGTVQQISMRAVVRDDVLLIEPGDRLVVDGVTLHSDALEMDESLLTGESDAIFKQPGDEVFSGSFCIAGAGTMRATRVGKDSNINRLSATARQYKNIRTPTQVRLDIIVELTLLLMFVFAPMLFVTAYLTEVPFLDAIRNTVVFVTSLVPQGLILVAILSLTIGALKITRQQTLIQKVNAVESLANATVLCFDKTGTLTKNQLAVTQIISLNHESKEAIMGAMALYLRHLAHLNRTAGAVQQYVTARVGPVPDQAKVKEIPFTSGRKWGAVLFADETLVMGAPERLLPRHGSDDSVLGRALKLSQDGMRVLAFARMTGEPAGQEIGGQCEPVALIVLSDQVREDIQETLAAFRAEQLELKVISGDSLETVQAIARQAGMTITGACTGAQLEAFSEAELERVALETNVFARVEPETKRRIISALQRQKHYVAMVGDGVNDVPALKQANLAIVMNDGTQISKDVADIVLLNNAMSTLPLAFHEGKEITQTVFGTMKMFLVKNFYTVLLFVFAGFMALPFPMTPVQISWATFGAVNIPATLVAFGLLRPAKMQRFRHDVLDYIFTVGFIGAVLHTILYVVVYFGSGHDVVIARSAVTVYFTTFSAYAVWTILGANLYEPATFRQYRGSGLIMLVLGIITIIAMYIFPDLAEFSLPPAPWLITLLVALQLLAMILLAHGMKYRYLLRRMWDLFREDERR
ncbi:MAG: cation-translocating P-type ATPase [Anaerolineae bacterium]|nr:cation-translocating P-type ATPase [Anaerolineae bacterium]